MDIREIGGGWVASDWQARCRRRGGVGAAMVARGIGWWREVRARPCVLCWQLGPFVVGFVVGWWT